LKLGAGKVRQKDDFGKAVRKKGQQAVSWKMNGKLQ
jgi:hypothetical protein